MLLTGSISGTRPPLLLQLTPVFTKRHYRAQTE